MAIVISGQTGIDAGHLPISNAGNTEVEGTLTAQGQNVSPFSGFKNYIIDGNFDFWYEGTSQTSSGYGSDTMYINGNSGSTKTHSQQVCGDTERALFNARYFSRTVVSSITGADNYAVKIQILEDVTRLAGKTVTISFWAKADSNKNIAIELEQQFGNGGSPSAPVFGIGSQLVALTTTWQKKTITVTIPSVVGKTLGTDGVHTSSTRFNFWFDAGSNSNARSANLGQQSGTFDIAQVQLEEGSVATPFENRPLALEEQLVNRYYEINILYDYSGMWWSGYVVNGGSYFGSTLFKVQKRVNPTMTKLLSESLNTTALSIDSANINGIRYSATGTATSVGYFRAGWSADARF